MIDSNKERIKVEVSDLAMEVRGAASPSVVENNGE